MTPSLRHGCRYAIVAFMLFALTNCGGSRYVTLNADELNKAIELKHFVFLASTATPLSGGLIQLNGSNYDVQVSKDTVIAYLPYFGRSYTSSYGTANNGIRFTSTNFEYEEKKKSKGGWAITIKLNDNSDVRSLQFDITGNNNSSLNVASNNRQAISFNGKISSIIKK